MPRELWYIVFQYLDPKSRASLSGVNTFFREMFTRNIEFVLRPGIFALREAFIIAHNRENRIFRNDLGRSRYLGGILPWPSSHVFPSPFRNAAAICDTIARSCVSQYIVSTPEYTCINRGRFTIEPAIVTRYFELPLVDLEQKHADIYENIRSIHMYVEHVINTKFPSIL